MKKTLLILSVLASFLAACGGSTSENETEDASATTTASAPSKPAMDAGELLIVKSDCIGCHQKENKMVGPAYLDVAAKYPATDENIAMLASKIMKGGKGVWGTVPMTPHPKITEDEAKSMVKYILSLKK
ncbi:MAG: c-type cytochrome [Pedobacter sp.]|nr:c-type cytochrome [Pedobacter sp.]